MITLNPENDFTDSDGNTYNYDQYKIGDSVQWLDEDEERWVDGTLVRIDYQDPSLPWGVSHEPTTLPKDWEDSQDFYDEISWNWRVASSVRFGQYVIDEEEDEWTSISTVLAKAN